VAHFWYFIEEGEVGFAWTGRWSDPMEVSFGGFGEPPTYRAKLTPHGLRERKPRDWTRWFKRKCDLWVERNSLVCAEALEVKIEDRAPNEPQQGDIVIQRDPDGGFLMTPLGRKVYSWLEVWQVLSAEFHDTQKYPNVWMYEYGHMRVIPPGFGSFERG